ncbi:polysaccharide biosynthesis C-terminal domain-containing protein [Rhizobium sp. BK251]|uniref:lipopolysaccharide biosynthesis protein n=1 Tax=Rhizobium sp. BK251 TaxID=2512125 RepID=UPI0010506162|nr:polysaccharide biosynthesis C-terminal domain-containing protein [Rhizobium sp. BK251]TCL72954.1 O-antigen/teichoic acid export membrane protein [Rhizobium sp. BK251]
MAKSIMANSALNAAAGMTTLLTGFFSSIVAARLLGPEANGIIAFSLWLVTTGALVAEIGTGITLLRLLPQLKVQGYSTAERRGFAAYLVQPTIISTLVLLLGYIAFYWEGERLHWATSAPSIIFITGVLFLVQSIGAYTKNYLIGEQQLGTFFRLTVASSVLQMATVLLGAIFFGVGGALTGYILGQVLMFAYTLRIAAAARNSCGIGVSYLVSTSFILSLEYINSSIFLNRIELLFLQKYWGVEAVGFYAVGLSLANLALQLPTQLSGSLLPYYSEKMHSHATGRLPVSVFEGVVRSIAYITLPMSFGLAAISGNLVVAIFGQPFEPSGGMVALLSLTAAPYVFMQICTQYLYSMGRIRERLIVGGIASVVMVVGCLAAVPWYGGEGAAVVRLAAFTVMCGLMVRQMEFEGSMRGMFVTMLKVGAASLLSAGAAYAFVHLLPHVAGLAAAIIAGALVYVVALRLFNAVPEEDITVMKAIASRLPKAAHPVANQALALLAPRRA